MAIDIDNWLRQIENDLLEENELYRLMISLVQGSRLAFDRKTHRQIKQRYNRLNYVFLAALVVQKMDTLQLKEEVLEHLENALESMKSVWGRYEINRLSLNQVAMGNIEEKTKNRLKEEFGEDEYLTYAIIPVSELPGDKKNILGDVLGKRIRNEINRELLLSIISQMWVEYLTKVEALRVSIGLEAYGQRDPLVQYKGKASELFKSLLVDIRSALVNRIFTYRPSNRVNAAIEKGKPPEAESEVVVDQEKSETSKKKRRRKRH